MTRPRSLAALLLVALALAALPPAAARTRPLFPRQRQRVQSFVPPAEGKIRVAFLDADSTLRLSCSGAPTPNRPSDQVPLPMTGPKIAELVAQGYLIAVVSNQGGVEKGYATMGRANRTLRKTCELVSQQPGCAIHYYDFAPRSDEYRKPAPGMAEHLARVVKQKYGREIDWQNSLMVGDAGWKKEDREPSGRAGQDFSNADRLFAEGLRQKHGCTAAGMAYHHPRDFFGWARLGVRSFRSLADVAQFLEQHPQARRARPR